MTVVINGTTGISGVDGSASTPAVQGTDSNTGVFYPAADTVALATGGSERVRVDTSGNVGIGTSSPQNLLNVVKNSAYSSAAANAGLALQSDSGATYTAGLHFGTDKSGALSYIQSDSSASYTAVPLALNPLGGNVGIGTTSPSGILHTYASNGVNYFESPGISGVSLQFKTNGLNRGRIGIPSSVNALAFWTDAGTTEAMRIDSSGNLLVGTTSAGGKITSTTASQTAVYAQTTAGTSAPIYSYVGYASSTATPALRCVKYDNNSTTSQVFVQFAINQDGANNGQINANGASTAAFGSYSDVRLKENIVDLPSQLGNIMALRPVEFDYIGVEDGHQIGFIAQEMQEVYPDAVSVGNDEMLMITAWSKTEARLVKAIQEQQTLIQTLTDRITALENK